MFSLAALLGCNPAPSQLPADGAAEPPPAYGVAAQPPVGSASASPLAPRPSAAAGGYLDAAVDELSGAAEAGPPPSAPGAPDAAPTDPPAPSLFAPDGTLLPQTEQRPSIDEPLFEHGLELLWRAIVADDPEIARPFFFPLPAYEQVKAIADPKRDWKRRLWKLFVRDIHDYHRELGDDPDRAEFERFELRERDVQWVKPHGEGNAIGYWRVRHSKLHARTAAGQAKRLDVTALISWRGHWHVVHLHGFK